MKAYITCPVTGSRERLNLLPEIEGIAKECGLDTFVFIVGGTPEEIFQRDYEQVKSCDIIIAEVSELSHGVGIEIGFSYCLGLKRILLVQEREKLSKLAQGIPQTIIVDYKDADDMKVKLKEAINKLT